MSAVVVPPVTVRVGAYELFQTSAARAPKVESVLPEVVQTSAAVMLCRAEMAPVIVPVEEVTSAVVARPERSEVLARPETALFN